MFWIFPSHTLFASVLPMAHMTVVNSELKRKRISNICFSNYIIVRTIEATKVILPPGFCRQSQGKNSLGAVDSYLLPALIAQSERKKSCFTNKRAKRWESTAHGGELHTVTTFCSQSMRTSAARWANKKSSWMQRRQHERGKTTAKNSIVVFHWFRKYGWFHLNESSNTTRESIALSNWRKKKL